MYTSSVPPATPQRQFISEFQPITKSYLETSPWHAITLLRSVGYGSFHDSNDTVWSSVGCCQAAFFCFFSLVVGWSSKQVSSRLLPSLVTVDVIVVVVVVVHRLLGSINVGTVVGYVRTCTPEGNTLDGCILYCCCVWRTMSGFPIPASNAPAR